MAADTGWSCWRRSWRSWSLLAILLAVPALLRLVRRRRRLRAGRAGDPDALWAELAATATDLGHVLSPARTPRQVAGDLGSGIDQDSQAALGNLALAVERSRYAATPAAAGGLLTTLTTAPTDQVEDLTQVESALRQRRTGRERVLARLRPASLRRSGTGSALQRGWDRVVDRVARAPRRH